MNKPSNRNANEIKPENIFLLICFLIGIILCIFIPFGTGFDEDQHLVRVYDLAHLNFLPNRGEENDSLALSEFFTLSYRRSFFLNQAADQFSPEVFLTKPNKRNIYHEKTRAIYSPILYMPQSFLAGLMWIKNSFPVIPGTIFLRLLGLLIYISTAYVSIKIIPFGKWVLLVLALSPMAIYQSSTVNADVLTNSISLLFTSYIVKLKIENKGNIQNIHVAILVLLTLLIGLAKPGTVILVLLTFLITPKDYQTKKQWLIVLFSVFMAFSLTFIWWYFSTRGITFSTMWDTDMQSNFLTILKHPLNFLVQFFLGTIKSIVPYTLAWIAAYGYWVGSVPLVVYLTWLAALFLSLIAENSPNQLSNRNRVFLMSVSFVSILTILLLYNILEYTTNNPLQKLGAQGRYLIPFTLPFFLALVALVRVNKKISRIIRGIIPIITLSSLLFFSLGLYMTYYATCWEKISEPKKCTLPHYQNINTSTPPYVLLEGESSIKQQLIPECENLTQIEILIGKINFPENEKIDFLVQKSNGTDIQSTEIPVNQLKPYTKITVDVSETDFILDETHILSVSAPQKSGYLEFAIRPVDVYPGQMRVNDEEFHGDLIFYYSCLKNP